MEQRRKKDHTGRKPDKAPAKSLVTRITEKLKTRPRPKAAASKPPVS